MTTLSKKQSIAIFAIAFAAVMIVGTVAASASDNLVFATNKNTKQVKAQNNANQQRLICQSSGGISIGTGSSGLGLGTGAGVGGAGGANLCFNSNANTNAETGSQAAQTG